MLRRNGLWPEDWVLELESYNMINWYFGKATFFTYYDRNQRLYLTLNNFISNHYAY